MTHLLDTHAWIQRAAGDSLPAFATKVMQGHPNSLAIADISIWEASKLVEVGRLELQIPLSEFYRLAITQELTVLPITPAVAECAGTLESRGFHKDPADQLIVATALVHGLKLVTNDSRIQNWGGVPVIWKSEKRPKAE